MRRARIGHHGVGHDHAVAGSGGIGSLGLERSSPAGYPIMLPVSETGAPQDPVEAGVIAEVVVYCAL